MLIAGTGVWTPAPATDLLVGLTLPQEPYSDPSEQRVDGFYQQLDHRLILLSASIGEPGPYRAFLYEASIRNPLLQFPRQELIGSVCDSKISGNRDNLFASIGKPAPVDRFTLIGRVTFDLTGKGRRDSPSCTGCDVGRDGILRRVGNPPLTGAGLWLGRPIRHRKAECHSAAGCHPAPQCDARKLTAVSSQPPHAPAALSMEPLTGLGSAEKCVHQAGPKTAF
jgi:hypothetical protein